jgi:hypothetical protein
VIGVLLLLAVSVRQDQKVLRAGCEVTAPPVATLTGGQPVTVRFAISGDAPCYKVAVERDGKVVSGYLSGSDLSGLEAFDGARRDGGAMAVVGGVQQQAAQAVQGRSHLRGVVQAIEGNEPARALELLKPMLSAGADPDLLALAGVAAWRNDEPRSALDYWNRSLRMRPDARIEELCRTVEREASADRSNGRAYGLRVLLRYEPDSVKPELARSMVLALDAELERIAGQLGCSTRERLVAIVQSREAYLKSTGAAEWSGGRYDGRIRIALIGDEAVGPRTRRVFAHEVVHACLASMGSWPPWLHEGLAQWISGERLSAGERASLRRLVEEKKFPKLAELGRDLGSMEGDAARATYALALEAATILMEHYSGLGLRNVLANRGLLEQLTGELNRKLGL